MQVIVRLARPEKDPDGNDFRCAYQVVTPGKQKIRYIYGVDEFQALQLAIVIIEAELDRVGQEHGWNLKFLGGNIGCPRRVTGQRGHISFTLRSGLS